MGVLYVLWHCCTLMTSLSFAASRLTQPRMFNHQAGDLVWLLSLAGLQKPTFGASRIQLANINKYWLVVWLPFFIFAYIGNSHPN